MVNFRGFFWCAISLRGRKRPLERPLCLVSSSSKSIDCVQGSQILRRQRKKAIHLFLIFAAAYFRPFCFLPESLSLFWPLKINYTKWNLDWNRTFCSNSILNGIKEASKCDHLSLLHNFYRIERTKKIKKKKQNVCVWCCLRLFFFFLRNGLESKALRGELWQEEDKV